MRFITGVMLAVAFASNLAAQDLRCEILKATAIQRQKTVTLTEIWDEDGALLTSAETEGELGNETKAERSLLTVTTDAKNISVYADDINRTPVSLIKVSQNQWLIPPGKVWLDVRVIDFDKNIYDSTRLFVESEQPNIDVPNSYGLGVVSALNAPADPETRAIVSEQHRQAANFLYGNPTLKAVSNENTDDPESNVFAWLEQQAAEMQCPDEQTCKQWAKWRVEMGKAFAESQTKRQYKREDWFRAFLEIAGSLR